MPKCVEQNPTILGEELLIISSECDRFDKTHEQLDLLSLDKDGSLVVIELKRDNSGKNVDLQAIKYAAYCSTLRLADLVDRAEFSKRYAAYCSRHGGGSRLVVSWNFRHIVRLDKIRLFNGVNLELGYKPSAIYSPQAVATHGKED